MAEKTTKICVRCGADKGVDYECSVYGKSYGKHDWIVPPMPINKIIEKDYVAMLVVEDFPRTSEDQKRMVDWLLAKAEEIKGSDPDAYAHPWRARLMK